MVSNNSRLIFAYKQKTMFRDINELDFDIGPCNDFKFVVKILGPAKLSSKENAESSRCEMVVVVVGLPLLFLWIEVWREQQSRFMPST